MRKLKLADTITQALSALVAAARAIVKFIDYIVRLRSKFPAKSTA
jgi:hypothetical protein